MSTSGVELEVERVEEKLNISEKEKRHKHKKEKKHKRHKERHRSTPTDERLAADEQKTSAPVLENGILENGTKPVSDKGRQLETATNTQEPLETKLSDSEAAKGTPESGEISGVEPTMADGDSLDSAGVSPSKKRPAEREEGQGSSPKRLKSETDNAQGSSKLGSSLAAENAANPETAPTDTIQDRLATKAEEVIKPRSPSRHQSEERVKESVGNGSAREHSGKEKERDRHRSSKLTQDKPRSRSRASSRDRDRDNKQPRRDHRSDDRRDENRGQSHRQTSRDRREDERRRDGRDRRDDDRSYRRDDSRSRRDRDYRSSSQRREPSRSRRDDRDRDIGRDRGRDRDRDRGRHHQEADRKRKSREKEDKEFEAKVIAKLEENEVDEDELIEQRRRKRQELMAKLQQEKGAAEAVANPTASEKQQPSASPANIAENEDVAQPITSQPAAPALAAQLFPQQSAPPQSPLEDRSGAPKEQGTDSETEDEHGLDEGDEAQLFQQRREGAAGEGGPDQERVATPISSDERHKIANQGQQAGEAGFDMFSADQVDDMFGDAPVGAPVPSQNAPKRGLVDNFDDSEGYYNFQVGEIMNDRYEVFATHGKGVFSTVLRARDRKPVDEKGAPIPIVGNVYPEVAIKVIRANDLMSKAGQTEVVILRKLAGADPSGKYHIIRLLREFEYRNHLCLVFEPLESNLRQLTKKYGQGIGLRLDAVRSMAAQMLMALHLMKQCGVLHADIKPDNILINQGHNIVKICDFGSAMFMGNNEITPYLVSRFYRAPEIILGLHYDFPMDVWSIGCVIYELFTGRILFPGRSNNEMLKLMMDVKGPFPKKMLKKGEFSLQHFEDDPAMSFCLMEIDPLTKRPTKRLVPNPTIKKDFRGHLAGQEGESRQVGNLIDLLEKMMNLDPDKRITAKEALRHPFIKDGRTQTQHR